jgi:hypothetical protein
VAGLRIDSDLALKLYDHLLHNDIDRMLDQAEAWAQYHCSNRIDSVFVDKTYARIRDELSRSEWNC